MSTYGSDLQLRGVRVERLIYRINNDFEELELEVTLFDEDYREKKNPLYLKIKLVGIFEDTNYNPEGEDVFVKYLPNAISMLYSYARAHIASLTGMFGIDVIQIPTVNILKLLDDVNHEKD